MKVVNKILKNTAKLIVGWSLVGVCFATEMAEVDVLVVYSEGVSLAYRGGEIGRIKHLFNVANEVYLNSGINLRVNVRDVLKVRYSDDATTGRALIDVTNSIKDLRLVSKIRELSKSDMVVFYRPYKKSQRACGQAWVGRSESLNGRMTRLGNGRNMFAQVAINSCPDFVTVHEMAHNMGITHSRRQDKKGSTFAFATGYGVDGLFTDVMAYSSSFGVTQKSVVYKFSNPDVLCMNQACGVQKDQADGADARFAINAVAKDIAKMY